MSCVHCEAPLSHNNTTGVCSVCSGGREAMDAGILFEVHRRSMALGSRDLLLAILRTGKVHSLKQVRA